MAERADSENIAWYFHRLDARVNPGGREHIWKGAQFTGVFEQKEEEWKDISRLRK